MRKAAGNAFKCLLRLDLENSNYCGNKGSEVASLVKPSLEVILTLLELSGLQALLRGFGLLVHGFSIHNTHVVNTVRTMRP